MEIILNDFKSIVLVPENENTITLLLPLDFTLAYINYLLYDKCL